MDENFLDSAYRTQHAHHEAKERDAIRHPVSGEEMELGEHDRSISQIFANPKSQDAFVNHYLYQQNSKEATDIADALSKGNPLTNKQDVFLEKHRKGFNVLLAEIDQIKERLTPEVMQRLAVLDPRIATVVGKVTPENAADLFGQEMASLAMKDTSKFNRISTAMQNIHKVERSEDAKIMSEALRDKLEKYNLSQDEFTKATMPGMSDPSTRKNLQETVREQYGTFKRIIDSLSGKSFSQYASWQLKNSFGEQQRLLSKCDSELKKIGTVLKGTLTPEINAAIQKFIIDGTPLTETDQSNVRSFADLKQIRDLFDATAIKGAFQKRLNGALKEEAGILLVGKRKNGSLADIEQAIVEDRVRDEFSQEYADKIKTYKGSGIMQLLLNFLFSPSGGTPFDKASIRRML